MIDLHLHTTASDGFYSPSELVQRANKAKLRTISVTDHDTMAGVSDVIAASAAYGITVVPGVEITAVWQGLDIHLLGYFLDEA
ncbi:MAG: PHP domain-containing protein, partial [Acidobacteriota bacterium]|nr:PHP domain-containing protein [Acidobacteriota bacterium]